MALSNDTILFVGLGNPGEKYKNNRHNVGFMALDCLSAFYKFGRSRTKFLGRTAMGSLEERKLISFKPQTFMNESGRAVREASNFNKIGPERIIVFHDELDLPFGQVRVKKGGGHAGHNGLRDILKVIGSDFVRLRFGIGHPPNKEQTDAWVIKKPNPQEKEKMAIAFEKAINNIDKILLKEFYIFVIANGPSCNDKLECAGRRNYATGRAGSLGFRITRTLFAIAKILSPVFTSLSHKESPESGSLFLLA